MLDGTRRRKEVRVLRRKDAYDLSTQKPRPSTLRNAVRRSAMQKGCDQFKILDCLSSKREGVGGSP